MFCHDEHIHNENKYQKYVALYCSQCLRYDPLDFEDCQCRRTIYEKKCCLENKYLNDLNGQMK